MVPHASALGQNDSTWAWKFLLRSFAILVALAAITCVAWALAQGDLSAQYYDYSYGMVWVVWDLIPLGLSVIWNIANIAVLLKRTRAIHPGANVGCDLIIWLGFLAMGSLLAIGASLTVDNASYVCPYYGIDCYEKAAVTQRLQLKGAVELAATALSFALALFHFALFVSACRYVHQRKRDALIEQTTRNVLASLEMGAKAPLPTVPRSRENGVPVPEKKSSVTSEERAVGSPEDSPLPVSVPRTEGANYPPNLKATNNAWAPNEMQA